MLRWRILLGLVLVAALVLLCWLDARAATPGTWLLPLALLITALASGEVVRLLDGAGTPPTAWIAHAGNLAIVGANWPSQWPLSAAGMDRWGGPVLAFALSVAAALAWEVLRFPRQAGSIPRLAATTLALSYVGVLISFLAQLRLLAPQQTGLLPLLSLIAVVKMGDIGAYTVGRLAGRHKLAPALSPGKTIEGLIGGLLAAVATSAAIFHGLAPAIDASSTAAATIWGSIAFGLVVGAAGAFGDLAESLLKRSADQKDSSRWLPGFGGVLDILDALLLAAPVAYVCWMLGVVGGLGYN